MCRIVFSPEGTSYPNNQLYEFFSRLETLQGRDGNGIYTLDNNKLTKTTKHMNEFPKIDIEGNFIFHTRFGTQGSKELYNVQPFVGKRYVVCHNGHAYGLEKPSKLLGYKEYKKDYSDSYLIFYIIEKVGILRFFLTYISAYYGVVLVHDKQLNKTFLLKTSGSFEAGKLKHSGKNIYCSSNSDFWQITEKITVGNGLFRLEPDKIITLYEITPNRYVYNTKKTRTTKKRKRHKRIVWNNDDDNTCDWCYEKFIEGDRRFKTGKYIICEGCTMYTSEYEEIECTEIEPAGIGSLFPPTNDTNINTKFIIKKLVCSDCGKELKHMWHMLIDGRRVCANCYDNDVINKVPKFCVGCTWLKNDKCWYNHTKHIGFYYEKNNRLCHSEYSSKIPEKCHGCNWIKHGECWYAGYKNSFNSDVKNGIATCSTLNGTRSYIYCKMCKLEFSPEEEWDIILGIAPVCESCLEELRQDKTLIQKIVPLKCDSCGWHFEDGDRVIIDETRSQYICEKCQRYSFDDKKYKYLIYDSSKR